MLSQPPLLVLKMELESNEIAKKFEIKLQQNWDSISNVKRLQRKDLTYKIDIIPKQIRNSRGKKVAAYSETKYEIPTWNQIYDMLLHQAQKIQADGYKPDIIIGVARGGLVPSRILSDLLETKEFATIQIEYYDGINQTKQEPILKQCLNTTLTDKKTLLVDDISDSGSSLQLAKKHLQQQGAKEIKNRYALRKTRNHNQTRLL